ncbi:MAG: asparaginyl-tRNA synthetase [Cirrosporium novae-zelandiae]|nr:MAG: asparaginyl-tRNA synthetase [Cirrosporium novae-zelandiae]
MRRPLHQVVSLGSKSWFATPRFPITTSATTGARQTIASIIASQGSKYGPEDSIKVNGNVRTVRKSKKVAFAEVSDGSTSQSLQVVFEDPMQVSRLSTGCAVELAGHITPSPPGLEQQYELKANDVKVIGEADRQTYPLQKKYHSPDFLRSIPHMRIRTQFNSYLSRLRSESIYQLTQFFHNHPKGTYIQVQPPIITSSDCEGAGEVFTVSGNENEPVQDHGKDAQELFFRSPKYLTVSSQLHLEAYAAELGRVWTLSPTFRAEESDTPRHLAEFYMLEVEALHTRTLNDLMTLTEDMIRHLTVSLANSSMLSELKIARKKADPKGEHETISWEALQSRWMGLEAKDWPRINYTDAINILSKATASGQVTFKHQPTWAEGLALEHEKYIAKVVGSGSPVFVTDYPKKIKPFYMLPSLSSNDATSSGGNHPDTSTVACFDLLLPELAETVGGSLREHRLENLISSMRSHGLLRQTPAEKIPVDSESSYPYLRPDEDIGSMRWYADLRRWGSVPHGGFGLGFDRLLAYLSGVGSLRDVVPFPRFYGRCDC